jgi:hypothetical protein
MKASKTLLRAQGLTHAAMAVALGVMALAVFVNVVLRYGFGSGIAASEELSRLLFVWMVFLGAAAAYPAGEHMAFTSLAGALQKPAEDFFRAHGADPSAGDGRLRHAGLGRLAAGGGGLWQPLGGAGLLDGAAAPAGLPVLGGDGSHGPG